jgi:hypothetical protein
MLPSGRSRHPRETGWRRCRQLDIRLELALVLGGFDDNRGIIHDTGQELRMLASLARLAR